jgi:hypothetical protein
MLVERGAVTSARAVAIGSRRSPLAMARPGRDARITYVRDGKTYTVM